VLDDSTDDTTERARRRVARARERGVNAIVLHRARRAGFKAGALAAGLAQARGTLICVFDADFVPPPDFLRRVVGEFADPGVGMVQARWGHLNRDWSALTQAQAIFLDGHFSIEQAARAGHGRFFNFNGTAGVWRRAAIEDAGGWTHDTLTEDLDLSYRAQMKGWRFVYRDDVEAPAELPVDIRAFKGQQRRWAKGSLQTARKILPALWASPAPLAIKLEATGHLTCNLSYLLLILSILLLGPALVLPDTMPRWLSLGALSLLFATGMGAVAVFFYVAQRARGTAARVALRRLPAALLLGVGMAWTNGRAVAEAFLPGVGGWERTPKEGVIARGVRRPGARYRPTHADRGFGEALMAALALALVGLAVAHGRWGAIPFLVFLASGFAWVGWLTFRAGRGDPAWRRRRAPATAGGASRVPALLTTSEQ
ncbi:MAG: glycosyltransferase family 2 protein, partial [Candidatus Eisenbacteria bacterium]